MSTAGKEKSGVDDHTGRKEIKEETGGRKRRIKEQCGQPQGWKVKKKRRAARLRKKK